MTTVDVAILLQRIAADLPKVGSHAYPGDAIKAYAMALDSIAIAMGAKAPAMPPVTKAAK